LRAEVLFPCWEDQKRAWSLRRSISRAFEPEFNLVLLLTRTWYQFNHLSIQFYPIYHCSRLAFCLFCALPPLGNALLRSLFW
jgi:hypothetical protein